MKIEVTSKITVKMNNQEIEISRDEAMQLFSALKYQLNIVDNPPLKNYPWFQMGNPDIATPGIAQPLWQPTPASPHYPGAITC